MNQPIVDAHHHIWRLADLAWLQGPSVPRIFGAYDPIKRDYPVEEFRADAESSGVVRSVYVQTNWPKGRQMDEVRWVEEVAARTGWPHAIVSHVDLFDEGAPAVIAEQVKHPLVRGVRQQLHWHANPQYRFAEREDICRDPTLRRNLTILGEHGLPFELQIFTSQMADGADLVAALPGVTFILEHAGMLEDLSEEGRRAWREGMKRLADRPNLHVKLSGLGTFLHRIDPGHIAEIVGETVGIFGADRCVWGSNFPIEKLWTDYGSLVAAVKKALEPFGEEERHAMLYANAMSLFRLED